MVFWCAWAGLNLWLAIVASSVPEKIGHLLSVVIAVIAVWYLWLVRRDAHLCEPLSWWPGRISPRS